MARPTPISFEVVQGNTFSKTIIITDEKDNPIINYLSGIADIAMHVVQRDGENKNVLTRFRYSTGTGSAPGEITVLDNNTIRLYLSPSLTALIPVAVHECDIEFVFNDGNIYTLYAGTFEILEQITEENYGS
ncbi:MAG: hypothetical protein ACFB15_03265 [Cyclobacteriaceae bacterium]